MADDEPQATPGQMVLNVLCGLFFLALAGLGAWSYYDDNWGAASCAARPHAGCLEAPWRALTLHGRGGAVLGSCVRRSDCACLDTAAAVTLVEKRSASHTFVMSGLDPGIYDEPPKQEPYVSGISPPLMDCRVKPGNDAAGVLGISSHYRENFSPPPRTDLECSRPAQ